MRPGPKPWAGAGVLLPPLPPAVAAVAVAVAVAALYPLWLYGMWVRGPGTCVQIGLSKAHLNHTHPRGSAARINSTFCTRSMWLHVVTCGYKYITFNRKK